MARIWKIRKFDGDDHKQVWSVSGALSEPEICTMLQRLVSQNLSDDEIISASLRKNDRHHNTLLERIGPWDSNLLWCRNLLHRSKRGEMKFRGRTLDRIADMICGNFPDEESVRIS